MSTNNSINFLTLNSVAIERLQDDDDTYGYDYNRIADALDGLRSGVVSLVNPILTIVNQSVVTAARVYDQSIDPTFPGLIRFVLPNGFKPVTATISWAGNNFRYVPTGSGGGTTSTDSTATTPSTDTSGESGHTHSHFHSQTYLPSGTGAAVVFNAAGTIATAAGGTDSTSISTDSTASSGHSHSHNHGSHTHSHNHTFSGITFSYAEGTSSTIDALLIDGIDRTSALTPAGPWATDQVLINLLSFFPSGDGKWHSIQLNPHAQGRFTVELTFGG